MTTQHIVGLAEEASFATPSGWAADAKGFRRWPVVGEDAGAVHTGFFLAEMDPEGHLPTHVHSFETSFFVVEAVSAGRALDIRDILTGGRFRVLEQSQAETLLSEVIDDTLRELLTDQQAAVMDLSVVYGLRPLKDMLRALRAVDGVEATGIGRGELDLLFVLRVQPGRFSAHPQQHARGWLRDG